MEQIDIIASLSDALLPSGIYTMLRAWQKNPEVNSFSTIIEAQQYHSDKPVRPRTIIVFDSDFAGFCVLQCQRIRDAVPDAHIILIISDNLSIDEVKEILKLKKIGIIKASSSFMVLVQCIQDLKDSEYYVCDSMRKHVLNVLVKGGSERSMFGQIYTKSEMDVIELSRKGLRILDIAKAMSLSVNTIAAYRSRIIRKSGCHSMIELIARLNGSKGL